MSALLEALAGWLPFISIAVVAFSLGFRAGVVSEMRAELRRLVRRRRDG